MAARIGLAVVSLLTALALEAAGEDFSTAEWRGFYATIALAFTAAVAYGVALPRVREPRRFAAINLVTDVAIVSALVHFSGGTESVFTFLYVVVAFYAAMLFERRGALVKNADLAGERKHHQAEPCHHGQQRHVGYQQPRHDQAV